MPIFLPGRLKAVSYTHLDVYKRQIDMCGTDNEGRWHDMEPTPFIAVIKAESEEEACKKAATQMRYDPRCLFAIKVSE